jgi:hypothetical protein
MDRISGRITVHLSDLRYGIFWAPIPVFIFFVSEDPEKTGLFFAGNFAITSIGLTVPRPLRLEKQLLLRHLLILMILMRPVVKRKRNAAAGASQAHSSVTSAVLYSGRSVS